MIYTTGLKSKLRQLVNDKAITICHIEKYSGVHRYIVSRFLKLDEIGINYENGMALRAYYFNFKNQVPMTVKYKKKKEN